MSWQRRWCSLAVAAALWAPLVRADAPGFTFRYDLSTTAGRVALTSPRLSFDPRSGEILVIAQGRVHVFSATGMELHAFGADGELAPVDAIAPLEDGGDYLALVREGTASVLVRCDYRGAPVQRIPLSGVPDRLAAAFAPRMVAVVSGLVHLGDEERGLVIRTGLDGAFHTAVELTEAVGTGDEKGFLDPTVRGLAVDRRGNILFTVPTLFRAFVVSPAGAVRSFGTRGSTPGKFNVVTGIASDDAGNLYVVDTLRCVVMVFDPELRFVEQFAGRGFGPGGLIIPGAIVVGNDKVYVSQGRARGVSVYARTAPVAGG